MPCLDGYTCFFLLVILLHTFDQGPEGKKSGHSRSQTFRRARLLRRPRRSRKPPPGSGNAGRWPSRKQNARGVRFPVSRSCRTATCERGLYLWHSAQRTARNGLLVLPRGRAPPGRNHLTVLAPPRRSCSVELSPRCFRRT